MSESLFILEDAEGMQQHLVNLIQQGRSTICIFSSNLDPFLLNTESARLAFSTLVRNHRRAEVRFLVEDPQAIVDANHQLMHLYRRLPSKIFMRKLIIDPPESYQFMTVDDDKIWLQHKASEYIGFANYDARPEVKRFSSLFKDMWKHSEESPQLRRLTI